MTNSKKNSNLAKAKKAKNDEFYTQYADIEKEMNAYLEYDADVFRGKTVLLPCDDPEWSNFTLYFAQNFTRLGLKKLISTSYAHSSKNLGTVYQPSLFECSSPQFDKTKIWELREMEADHVTAWSKGGATGLDNCEMLCITHNRAKGNK